MRECLFEREKQEVEEMESNGNQENKKYQRKLKT